jgi:hypothetical protein
LLIANGVPPDVCWTVHEFRVFSNPPFVIRFAGVQVDVGVGVLVEVEVGGSVLVGVLVGVAVVAAPCWKQYRRLSSAQGLTPPPLSQLELVAVEIPVTVLADVVDQSPLTPPQFWPK